MRESSASVGQVAGQMPPPTGTWAFAINSTADSSDIEITLLSFVVVESLVRVTGLVRVRSRPDVRLASVPGLVLETAGGAPLAALSGHVLPHGALAWVSWLYTRPPDVLTEYVGRIEQVDLDHHTGAQSARPRQPQRGTWLFRFRLPPSAGSSRMIAALAD